MNVFKKEAAEWERLNFMKGVNEPRRKLSRLSLGREMLVLPGISRMDILGDAENPTFYRAQVKMNCRAHPTIFLKSGFERVLVVPGISRMDILGNAENPTFYRAPLKMNPRLTPRFS